MGIRSFIKALRLLTGKIAIRRKDEHGNTLFVSNRGTINVAYDNYDNLPASIKKIITSEEVKKINQVFYDKQAKEIESQKQEKRRKQLVDLKHYQGIVEDLERITGENHT